MAYYLVREVVGGMPVIIFSARIAPVWIKCKMKFFLLRLLFPEEDHSGMQVMED